MRWNQRMSTAGRGRSNAGKCTYWIPVRPKSVSLLADTMRSYRAEARRAILASNVAFNSESDPGIDPARVRSQRGAARVWMPPDASDVPQKRSTPFASKGTHVNTVTS